MNIKLNDRMSTALPFVRNGAIFADVGTDHAYLPIFLASKGIITHAIASDINEGPLLRAKENTEKYGLEDKIDTVLCDGLSGLFKYAPTDIAVFGMGGELIARILGDADWVKNENIRLILQPMTHQEILREYLAENGFKIIGELLSFDRGRIYQTICAEFDGKVRDPEPLDLILGEHIRAQRGELFYEMLDFIISITEKKIEGKRLGADPDINEEETLLKLLIQERDHES